MKRREIDLGMGRTRIIYENSEETITNTRPSFGVSIVETHGEDGSRLESKVSQAYVKSIKSRTFSSSNTTRTVYPGDYGSGKKVPRDK